MKINQHKVTDYFLVLLLITLSGIPVFRGTNTYFNSENMQIFLFIISLYFFINRKRKIDNLFAIILLLLTVLFIIQGFIFSFVPTVTIAGFFVKLIFTAYFIVKITERDFINIYIRIMYYIAIVSLIFYTTTNIIPGAENFLINHFTLEKYEAGYLGSQAKYHLGLYNIMHDIYRNSGPFWEPGAFSGYLLVAYIFNFYLIDKYKQRRNVIFLIAILSTVSTTAYIALFVFLFFAYYKKIKNLLIKSIAVLLILTSGYYAFYNLDFLDVKINKQLLSAKNADPYAANADTQRFINILRDIEDFRGHEIFGRGGHSSTRYSHDQENQIATVGLTDILVRYGTPFFLLIMFFIYRSICSYLTVQNQRDLFPKVGIFITILITLLSEPYFNYPMYWSLLFLQFVYKKPRSYRL